jgi:hypothetical protein
MRVRALRINTPQVGGFRIEFSDKSRLDLFSNHLDDRVLYLKLGLSKRVGLEGHERVIAVNPNCLCKAKLKMLPNAPQFFMYQDLNT